MQTADQPITSRHNELVKHARSVRDGRNRNSIFIEGIRLCEEALRSPLEIETVIAAEDLRRHERGSAALQRLAERATRAVFVTTEVFHSLADTEAHQGLIVLARVPEHGPHTFLPTAGETPLLLILHGINNPANAGALLRTAEAAGANGVIATAGTTYLFSPKALRGAMGAAFRLPVWLGATLPEVTSWCRANGIRTVCADIRATQSHAKIDWRQPTALMLGAEAHGLTDTERALADELFRIPMQPPVESLNVAVAAGIALYEAAGQRCSVEERRVGERESNAQRSQGTRRA